MAEVVGRVGATFRVDRYASSELVVHGHAQHVAARAGSSDTVPVHNVAVHVTGQDLATFEV